MNAAELAKLPVLETCQCGWSTRVAKYGLEWHREVHKCRVGLTKPRARRGNAPVRDKIVRRRFCEFSFD